MKQDFFSGLPLAKVIQVIRDLSRLNLSPSREAFTRLLELEREGEDVEACLADILDGEALKQYRWFKAAPLPDGSDRETETTRSGYGLALPLWVRLHSVGSVDLIPFFEEVRRLHLQWCPVFTLMIQAGRKDLADGYRRYLFSLYE